MTHPNSMTPEEVALSLNITKNTVYQMVKRGELKAYRVGRQIRIDETDIANYKQRMQDRILNTLPTSIINKYHHDNVHDYEKSNVQEMDTFIICGQDLIIDILCRYLEQENPAVKILRSYKGSYNGLYELYNDRVNVATTHLWDGDTNSYNTSYVKNLLPGVPVEIIKLVKRKQGFYVRKGNPKNIVGWPDLARDDIKIINREKGSGTRVLLDEHLRLLNIEPRSIHGYQNIVNAHLSVATAVARGDGDLGIGNEKCAHQINGLDFIPIQQEDYDLVIKKEDLKLTIVQSLIKIIKSNAYRNELVSLGDYELC